MRNFTMILTLVLTSCFATVFAQTVLFVKPTGSDASNGASWGNAKATLAGALNAAGSNAHIYMMVGSYSCANVTIPNGVTVTGGYSSTSTGTDTTHRLFPGANSNWKDASKCTILDGNSAARIATVNSGGKLEGCVIQHGKVTGNGGGVLVNGGTVLNCVIIRNSALDANNLTAKGGGAYVQNNGRVLNCVIAFNYANNGPAVAGTDGTLINNTIVANYAILECGTVSDIDGNTYNTVLLGEQCWMRENLRTTRYADGVAIEQGTSTDNSTPYRYTPNEDAGNVATYGYLYNWPAVMHGASSSSSNPSGVLGVCPTGWHVPSDAEWTQLVDYLKTQYAYICGSSFSNVAKSLASTTGWEEATGDCRVGVDPIDNNATGFGMLPAGLYNGSYGDFGEFAYYWSTTQYNASRAWFRYLKYDDPTVRRQYNGAAYNKSTAFSVRCLQD